MRTLCAILVLWALAARPAGAVSFSARLGQEGDLVQISYVLKDAKGRDEGEPRFPDFRGLKRVDGPSVSTSISIVNGAASQEKSWTFRFVPTSDQPVKVGPASITVGGVTYSSEALTVPGLGQRRKAGGQPARLSFEAEPRRPVVGQAVRLRLRLDFQVSVRGYDPPALASAPGFVVTPLERKGQPEVGTRTVDGQSWQTAVLAEWLLFPVREGRLRLEPLSLNIQAEEASGRRGRDPFDFFGSSLFNRLKTYALSTDPLVLEVAPLPGGAPVEFKGAVGSFSLRAAPDRTTLKAGEALTLTVTVEGSGYLSGIEAPDIEISPDLERYDTQTESEIKPGPRGEQGRRRFKTLLVPRVPGEQRVGEVALAFYDPASGSYRRLSAGPWTLTVSPGEGGATALPATLGPGGEQVRSYGQDIRQALPLEGRLARREAPPHHRWPWLTGLALVLAVVPAAAGGAALREHRQREAPVLRGRGALRRARRRLAQAGDQALGQEEALRGYLADRLRRAPTGLLLEDCTRELAHRGAPEALHRELEEGWRRLEFARYGGGAGLEGTRLLDLLARLDAWFAAEGRR